MIQVFMNKTTCNGVGRKHRFRVSYGRKHRFRVSYGRKLISSKLFAPQKIQVQYLYIEQVQNTVPDCSILPVTQGVSQPYLILESHHVVGHKEHSADITSAKGVLIVD
jgi:hypothetical protein